MNEYVHNFKSSKYYTGSVKEDMPLSLNNGSIIYKYMYALVDRMKMQALPKEELAF